MMSERRFPPSPASSSSGTIRYVPPDSPSPPHKKGDFCHVTVRLRPLTIQEKSSKQGEIWEANEERQRVRLYDEVAERNKRQSVEFNFDEVLVGSDNHTLYDRTTRKIVWSAMEGINGTVFAYGQTASGKTYTMMGIEEQPGVIPQAVEDVFNYIREEAGDREYLLRVSYLEIYNETIRDLLSPEIADVRIHEDRKRGVYVSPLKEEIVTTPKQVMKVIQRGEQNRHFGSTDYNEHSSRSHTIFQMIIESRDGSPATPVMAKRAGVSPTTKLRGAVTISQLNLIDLAGSEKATTDLDRRKEGSFINKSLLTLGNVISKLTEEKGGHIPFRDSKLTRILQPSLSGNANIAVVCTVSPAAGNYDETLNTLKFAARVKKVTVNAKANQVLDDKALLQKYRNEIMQLKSQMQEATEMVEQVRQQDAQDFEQERQKWEEKLHESHLVRTALKERIEHLTRLILSSQTITSKTILDWNAPTEPGSKRASVMVDGLLPSALTEEGGPQDKRVANLAKRGTPAPVKSMSRQLSDKDFVRRHIAEIDSRDERIKQLENLVAVVKGYAGSPDRNSGDIMAAIKDFEQDAEHVIPGVDDVKGEVEKLRKTNERLEIVCQDQAEKLEMLSRQLQAERASRSRSRTPPDQVKFEESSMYRKMRLEIEEQRRQIAELRAVTPPVLQERKQSVTSIGSPHFGRSSSTDPNSPRVKDLEIALDKERRVRNDMQAELLEKIASLEAELAIAKTELSVAALLSPANPR